MSVSPSVGGWVSRTEGKQGIAAYVGSPAFAANQNVKAHFIGSDFFNGLLSQPGCVGLRIWYGMKDDGTGRLMPQVYVVGVDQNNNDILPPGAERVADHSLPCPTACPGVTSLEN